MQSPLDVPLRHTLEFVASHLPAGAVRLLEVGCGDGALAQQLVRRAGLQLIAIDADPAAAERARRRGVDARCADWFTFDDGAFDAILFTRSLHHLLPVEAAVRRAVGMLTPAGRIIAEDHDYEAADARSLAWLRNRLGALNAEHALRPAADAVLEMLLAANDPQAAWRAEVAGHIATGAEVAAALEARVPIRHAESAAYLYRYACRALPAGASGAPAAAAMLAEEQAAIRCGAINAIGRRFVAARMSGDGVSGA